MLFGASPPGPKAESGLLLERQRRVDCHHSFDPGIQRADLIAAAIFGQLSHQLGRWQTISLHFTGHDQK